MTGAMAPMVAAICARLEGLPLAIELAAPWVKLLPPAQLLERLDRQLPLLTGGVRDLEEHQQTMRSTLAWSHDLLSPAAQRLFRRLAVFVGGCTLDAAEAVCLAHEGAEPLGLDLLDGLAVLVDHSLVQQRDEACEPRFGMLQVVREYGLERLETSEAGTEAAALRRAQAAYYVALAEREWASEYTGTTGTAEDRFATYMQRLESEQDNLRAALAWLRARAEAARRADRAERTRARRKAIPQSGEAPEVQGLRLASALVWCWAYRGQLGEGRAWLAAFLDLATPSVGAVGNQAEQDRSASSPAPRVGRTRAARAASAPYLRGRALYGAGLLAYWQGDSAQAIPPLEQSLAIFQALGDRPSAAFALNNLGLALKDQGDLARAQACYEQCVALGRALGEPVLIGMPLGNLGSLALAAGDLEQAALYSEEALAISRQTPNDTLTATDLTVQALIAWQRGQVDQAAILAAEALVLHRAVKDERHDERHYADGLEVCAIILASQGCAEQAARLLGAAAASRERIGMRRPMDVPTLADIEAAAAARAALGEEAWAEAYEAGQALSLEEAIAQALGAAEEDTHA
jgi:tetratricopeptide (TPR) repeat protein